MRCEGKGPGNKHRGATGELEERQNNPSSKRGQGAGTSLGSSEGLPSSKRNVDGGIPRYGESCAREARGESRRESGGVNVATNRVWWKHTLWHSERRRVVMSAHGPGTTGMRPRPGDLLCCTLPLTGTGPVARTALRAARRTRRHHAPIAASNHLPFRPGASAWWN